MMLKQTVFGIISLLSVTGANAATIASGTLDGSNIVGTGPWTGFVLNWSVDSTNGVYTYTYNYNAPVKDLSHIIIELSTNFDPTKFLTGTTVGGEINTYTSTSHGNSNPGLPGTLYGIKWDSSDISNNTVQIVTPIAPQWGDFYAKDGKVNRVGEIYAYNAGITSDYEPYFVDVDYVPGKLLRPDTEDDGGGGQGDEIPNPGILSLFGLGLLGMARKFY